MASTSEPNAEQPNHELDNAVRFLRRQKLEVKLGSNDVHKALYNVPDAMQGFHWVSTYEQPPRHLKVHEDQITILVERFDAK